MLYLRLNFTTGDAAGQNMVGKAILAVCQWIQAHYPQPCQYLLSGGIETDKKHSHMNKLHARGKRVIAEVTLKKELMQTVMRADTRVLSRMRTIQNLGAMIAAFAYNGAPLRQRHYGFFLLPRGWGPYRLIGLD